MTLHTTHVGSPDLPSVDNIKRGGGDVVSNRVESESGSSELVDFDIRNLNDGKITQGA